MMRYRIAPLLDLDTALREAKKRCPQILSERNSENPNVMAKRLTAYLLLADLCGGTLPQMRWDANGKPFFADGLLFCSLSHTDTGAAAVIADCPIGIDLQKKVSYTDRLAERVCASAELAFLRQADSWEECDLRFARIWSGKEAVVKIDGTGLAKTGLKHIVTVPDLGSAEVQTTRYRLEYPKSGIPDTVCCIAVQE